MRGRKKIGGRPSVSDLDAQWRDPCQSDSPNRVAEGEAGEKNSFSPARVRAHLR